MKKPEIISSANYTTERFITNMYSFDRAFNAKRLPLGVPIGKGWEVMGTAHTGKSTVVSSLAGMFAKHTNSNICLGDLEGFEPEHLVNILTQQGFDGIVYNIDEEMDEETLTSIPIYLKEEDYNISVAILDSIGAISPLSEQEGTVGEANFGRRAVLMAQFARKCLPLTKGNNKKTIFMINHYYPSIGFAGMQSPGGKVKDFLASIRLTLKQLKQSWTFPDGSYGVQGTVIKNRWGGISKEGSKNFNTFYLFIKSGQGIHHGLTAMMDAIMLKKATRKGTVKIGDESMGRLKAIILGANEFDFTPFYEALKENDNEKALPKEN